MDAARHWASGGKRDLSDAAREAREMGAPEEMLVRLEAEDGDFGVWAENWPAVEAFLFVCTQWRTISGAMGKVYWQGLDYSGVAAGLAGIGYASSPKVWEGLRVMEVAARNWLNGSRERD